MRTNILSIFRTIVRILPRVRVRAFPLSLASLPRVDVQPFVAPAQGHGFITIYLLRVIRLRSPAIPAVHSSCTARTTAGPDRPLVAREAATAIRN